jgi:RNA polymerase sigma-70 factor (ECF subfamily)
MSGVEVNLLATDLDHLLAACRDGDALAQRELYLRYHRRVYGLAVRLVGHREADDLSQEIFVRVFTGLDGFRKTASFSTWLYRVAVNECLRFRRAAPPAPGRLDFEPASREPAADRRLELADMLEHALQSLEPSLRIVFLLRHSEGLDYQQLSAVLGVPISTAATRLSRARAELQRLLGLVQGS